MASGRIRGITIEIGGDTTKLVSSLKKVDTQIRNTQNALKDVNKLLKMDPGNTELLRQKQQLLNDSITQTKDRLKQLKDAQSGVAQGTAEWDALQREIIETQQTLDGLEKDMKDFGSVTAQQVKVVGQKFQEVGGKIENAGRAISRVSGVAAAAIGGIAKMGYDAVTAADDLNTLAKQTGVSTDELQKWSYAADLVDVSTDTITSSMKKMKKSLDSNSDAFANLGVETKDSTGNFRDTTDIFYDTIAALSQIENETERDIAAMEIFGKGADELAGIIDDGGAALKAYGEEAEQMGLIIGGDTLDKLNEANDTIDKMKATMGASLAQAGATIAQTFAPVLEKLVAIIDAVAEKIRNLSPAQVSAITAILGVVAALGPLLIIVGKIVKVVGFVMAHLTAIKAVLAALTGPIGIVIAAVAALTAAFAYFYKTNDTFRNTVNTAIESIKVAFGAFVEQVKVWLDQFLQWVAPIVDQAKEYLNALYELVVTIVDLIKQKVQQFLTEHQAEIQAVLEIIKVIFEAAWTYISETVTRIVNNIKEIISGVLNIITSLIKAFTSILKGDWQGAMTHLKNATQSAVNMVKNVFNNFKTWLNNLFGDLIKKFKDWGADMIGNFVSGIKEKFEAVKGAVTGVADTIKSYLHFTEPDVGPLADFHTYAPDMMKLFAQGITQNAGLITDAIKQSFNVQPIIEAQQVMSKNQTMAAPVAQNNSPIAVNVTLQGDAKYLYKVVNAEAIRNHQITGISFGT